MNMRWVKEEGIEEGIEQERREGIRKLIVTCREFDASDDVIIKKLMEKYKLTYEEAVAYVKEN